MRENHNLFTSQISSLIADTAKTIIVKHSREMGIGHSPLGRWDIAYSEKTATVIERCNMRIDELTNEQSLFFVFSRSYVINYVILRINATTVLTY